MAVEKDKVQPVLDEKLKGKGYSKTFREQLASKLAAKIETEEDIETYIDDRLDILLEADKDGDRRVSEALAKATGKTKTEPKEEPKTEELPEDTPAWAKALIEKNNKLEEKLNGFEQANKQKTIAERFKSDPRVKDIPEKFLKGRIPQSEDDLETAITELETDWKEIATEHNIAKFGEGKPGGAATSGKGGNKQASKEEIDAVVKDIV